MAQPKHARSDGTTVKRRMPIEQKCPNLISLLRGLEENWSEDPAGLVYYEELALTLEQARQTAVARNVAAAKRGDTRAFGVREIARVLDVNPSNVSRMADRGRAVIAEREELAGVERFPAAAIARRRREEIAARAAEIRSERGMTIPVARTGTAG